VTGRAALCAVAVMAKAPSVGGVKTRLVPPLSAEEAADLSGCFLKDIADNILAAAANVPIRGHVAYSPAGSESVFRSLLPPAIELLPPRRSGLGASLYDAVSDLLAAGYGSVCLVNADSPTLPTALLVEAATALQGPGDRVVLGPASDGGYYLIGLKRPHRPLFVDIAWSTPQVLAQTRERAASLALETVLLPGWYDVDDLASLRRLIAGLRDGAGYAAPHTAAYLRRLLDLDAGRRGLDAEKTAETDGEQ
jgi:uncharacterized protein